MPRSTKWLTLLFVFGTAQASEANLSWTEPTQNEDGSPLTDLTSYEIHYGCTQSGVYGSVEYLNAPATAYTVLGLPDNGVCYFAAKAVNSEGTASVYSNEATRNFGSLEVPGVVTDTAITWQETQVPIMALPVLESFATAISVDNSSTTVACAEPSGVAVGDTLIILLANGQSNPVAAEFDDSTLKPTGFTLIDTISSGSSDVNVAAYWRIATGGESWPITATVNSSTDIISYTLRISGAHATTPIHLSGTPQAIGANSSFTVTALTTTLDDTLIIGLAGFDGGDGDPFSMHEDADVAYTLQASRQGNSSEGGGDSATLGWATRDMASQGGTGVLKISPVSSSDGWAGFAIAIAPAAAGGGAPENFLTLLGVGH